jgi:hypothetical protein
MPSDRCKIADLVEGFCDLDYFAVWHRRSRIVMNRRERLRYGAIGLGSTSFFLLDYVVSVRFSLHAGLLGFFRDGSGGRGVAA